MGDVAYRKAVDRGLEKVAVEQIVGTAQSSRSGEFDSQFCPLVPHRKQRWLRHEKLSPERAHRIIDLLRNEDRIVVELESGPLQVPEEPVGEGDAP